MEEGSGLSGEPASTEVVQAIKDVISSFLTAMKNYALYPEDHSISQKSVENVSARLNDFFSSYSDLRLDISKDGILFESEIVHQSPPELRDLGFLLFRDGIEWIEFRRGLELDELSRFFKILDDSRDVSQQSNSDLVTSLWEADFSYIGHETTEILWEEDALIDLTDLHVTGKEIQTVSSPLNDISEGGIMLQAIDLSKWVLTAQEINDLRETVIAEEKAGSSEEMLNLLLSVLDGPLHEKDFKDILVVLHDEFRDLLAGLELQMAFNLMKGLNGIRQSCEKKKPEVLPLLDHFLESVHSPEVLNAIHQIWPVLDILESHRKMLQETLILLPPAAILTLGPMLLEISSPHAQRLLTYTIESLASRDIRPLERLLADPRGDLLQRLLPVLRNLKGEESRQALVKMARHPLEQVRIQVIETLLERDEQSIEDLFPSIQDESETISRIVLEHLGKRRSEVAERLFLDYLKGRSFPREDSSHVLACYRALGRCGSNRSVSFLKEVLLAHGWSLGLLRSLDRQGAALALRALNTDEAEEVLRKAKGSVLPGVRGAYQKAMEGQ
jgi:hypothetical protein